MASSTTRPMASTIARSVMRFMENPHTLISMITPIIDSGIVTIGMTTDLNEPMNRVITTRTMMAASTMVSITSEIDSSMEMVLS